MDKRREETGCQSVSAPLTFGWFSLRPVSKMLGRYPGTMFLLVLLFALLVPGTALLIAREFSVTGAKEVARWLIETVLG